VSPRSPPPRARVGECPSLQARASGATHETFSPLCTYGNAALNVCIAQKTLTLGKMQRNITKSTSTGNPCVTNGRTAVKLALADDAVPGMRGTDGVPYPPPSDCRGRRHRLRLPQLRHRAYPHLRASTTGEERRSRLICRFSSIKGPGQRRHSGARLRPRARNLYSRIAVMDSGILGSLGPGMTVSDQSAKASKPHLPQPRASEEAVRIGQGLEQVEVVVALADQ
jgi:hypothetical protein